ncbi:MAG: zinc-binding dehydrogenase [Chloroflexi bacterium]|nr:zinc-binding dehydrogenase [Chloroflexota bacterium]
MKGVVFTGNRQLEIRDFADPKPGPQQVVIAMKSSGLCGSDLRPYRSAPEELTARQDIITGHEPCGQVVEVGALVRNVKAGDRIMVHHYSGCGQCEHCKTGWTQLCQDGRKVYGSQAHGGHADYELIEDYMCVPMPESLSFEEGAAIACGTGTAYQALKRLDVSGRDTLAVFGQGPVGLSATFLGAHMGARIVAVDPVPERRTLAKQHGAWATIDPMADDPVQAVYELTNGKGADATLDATGIAEVRANAVRSTRIWGRACLVGEGGTVTFEPTPDIIHRQLTLHGSWTFSTAILEELADWVVERGIPLKDIITHRFSLDQAREAYELFEGATTGKVVFNWT